MGRLGFGSWLTPAAALFPGAPVGGAPGVIPGDILGLRGPLSAPGAPPFALTLLVLLLAGALALTWWRLTRSRPPLPPAAEKGEDPARMLGELAAWCRLEAPPARLVCQRVDLLVRTALAHRSGLPAGRLTTDEFLAGLTAHSLLAEGELALAAGLLRFCDRVKFAGHDPGPDEVSWLMDGAGELIASKVRGES